MSTDLPARRPPLLDPDDFAGSLGRRVWRWDGPTYAADLVEAGWSATALNGALQAYVAWKHRGSAGRVARQVEEGSPEHYRLLFAILRAFLSPERSTPALAMATKDRAFDLDEMIYELWFRVEGGWATIAAEKVERRLVEERLFSWFLRRYDVRRARRVLARGLGAESAGLWLAVPLVGAFLALSWADVDWTAPWGLALLAAYLPVGLLLRRRTTQPILAVHSLVPRLAGSVAVGLVVILSSAELAALVLRSGAGAGAPGVPPVGLAVVPGLLYLLLEIQRRVTPPLPFRRLVARWWPVTAVGVSHALVGAAAGFPWVYRVLAAEDRASAATGSWAVVDLAGLLLAIGIVLHIIWAEQPVTESL